MSSCNRCGKTLHGLLPGFLCAECKSIERERDEDREREEEREEQAAQTLSEMLSESTRSREQSREGLATAAVYIANAKNNPGDYNCPSCLFRTLKRGASRCPKCHADPSRQYWVDVETKERDARLRAKEAAERAAKEAAEKAAQEAAERAESNRLIYRLTNPNALLSLVVFFAFTLPVLIVPSCSNMNQSDASKPSANNNHSK